MNLRKKLLFYFELITSIPKLVIQSFDKTKSLVKMDDFSFFTPEGWKIKKGNNFVITSSNSFSSNAQFSIYWYPFVFDHYDAVQNFIDTIKKQHKELHIVDFIIPKEIEYGNFMEIPAIFLEMKFISETWYIDNIAKIYIIHTDQRTYVITKYQSEVPKPKEIKELKEIEESFEFHEKFNPWNLEISLN